MLISRTATTVLCVAALSATCANAQPAATHSDAPRVPPAAHCLDARDVRQMEQADAASIAVLAGAGQAYRIEFTAACEGVNEASAVRLEAPQGWACGSPSERLVVDGTSCAVSAVTPIDSRAFAEAARQSRGQSAATLPTVTVTAQAQQRRLRHTFQGSSAFCFATRDVRGWSEDPTGIVVETHPRRNGGHRYYRMELGGSCTILAGAQSVEFQSGFQNGLICGNPGDRIVMARSGIENDVRGSTPRFARPGCPVLAVYPRD